MHALVLSRLGCKTGKKCLYNVKSSVKYQFTEKPWQIAQYWPPNVKLQDYCETLNWSPLKRNHLVYSYLDHITVIHTSHTIPPDLRSRKGSEFNDPTSKARFVWLTWQLWQIMVKLRMSDYCYDIRADICIAFKISQKGEGFIVTS